MRKQILAQLKKQYPGVSEKVLGLIANKLAKTVTEENGIEEAITALDEGPISIREYADFLQRDGDARVQAALAKVKKATDENPDDDDDAGASSGKAGKSSTDQDGDMPAWAKKLFGVVEGLVAEKTTTSMREKLAAAVGKDVPEKFYSRIALPEKEEDIQELAEAIKSDWKEIAPASITGKNKGLLNLAAPVNGVTDGTDDKVDDSVTEYAKRKVEAAKAQ